jgi:hypothetical protein
MFTRYPLAIPMRKKTAAAVAFQLYKHVFSHHGSPECVFSDREPGFAARSMKAIMRRLGASKTETTGLQPQSMGSLERFHGYFNHALTFCVNKHKSDWHRWIDAVCFFYRISTCESTGHSPYYLMYGRHPRLPVEAQLNIGDLDKFENEDAYVTKLTARLAEAYETARLTQTKRKEYDRLRRDAKDNRTEILSMIKGDWVMLFEPELRIKEAGKVPRRLEYTYSGPHLVYTVCDDPTHRIIIHQRKRKLVKANVNRLREWHPYSKAHLQTDPPDEPLDAPPNVEIDWALWHNEGDLVAIPLEEYSTPFLIGRLLKKRSRHHPFGALVQWVSNDREADGLCMFERVLQPGWIRPKTARERQQDRGRNHQGTGDALPDTICYFRRRPTHKSHQPYTNDDTQTVVMEANLLPHRVGLSHEEEGLLHATDVQQLTFLAQAWSDSPEEGEQELEWQPRAERLAPTLPRPHNQASPPRGAKASPQSRQRTTRPHDSDGHTAAGWCLSAPP